MSSGKRYGDTMDEDMTVEETASGDVEIDTVLKELAEKENSIAGNHGCIGCGELLALKIALQALGKRVVVHTGSEIALLARYPDSHVHVPFVFAGHDAAPAAAEIAKTQPVLAFSGDGAALKNMGSILKAASSDFIFISYNNQSSSLYRESIAHALSRFLPYTATASVSHVSDYVKKLRNASAIKGLKFIDVLSPCPEKWGFDPSLTAETARAAVEGKAWPLYEAVDGRIRVTSLPTGSKVDNYFAMQKRFRDVPTPVLEEIKSRIASNWKSINS